jgi:protein tyrosine phosphatase
MEAEYRILQRVTGHKQKYDALFKSFDVEFKRRNRYAAVIPFKYNRVRLMAPWYAENDVRPSDNQEEQIIIGKEPFNAYADLNKTDVEEEDLKKYINASWINSATK